MAKLIIRFIHGIAGVVNGNPRTRGKLTVAFLPDYVTADSVLKGKLVRLHVQDFRVVVWKQLLYRREKWVSLPMQAMIDHISRIRLVQR